MNPKTNTHFFIVVILSIVASACGAGQSSARTSAPSLTLAPTAAPTILPTTASSSRTQSPTVASTATPTALAPVTLKKGDLYFSINGTPSFIFSRNLAGHQASNYYQLLDVNKTGSSKLIRIQLDSFGIGLGYNKTSAASDSWITQWDQVLDRAQADGVYVIPVFGVWAAWNTTAAFSSWKNNPLNEAAGGLAKTPSELFQPDSATQKWWLQRMKMLVERWQGRRNIVAWEIFSEVNLVSGITQTQGIDFINSAASTLRAADSAKRPVSTSLGDIGVAGAWPDFYHRASLDYINIHPYPISGQLDRYLVTQIRREIATYNKPVLIGESGLSAMSPDSNPPTLTTAANASRGIRHAIWAGIVSGAMNGRALWWEDGYAIYSPNLNMPFIQKYADIEIPAANFVKGVDFSGFKPLTSQAPSTIFGAVIGNEKIALGWFRDGSSEPPNWDLKPVISKQNITVSLPGSAINWKVDFYSTKTGSDITSSTTVARQGNSITIALPDFSDDVAFKMYVKE